VASNVEQGYLVLADISGFTPFIAESELEHSYAILGEILKLIMGNLAPTLTIAEVEGDAVFGYVPSRKLPRGETLLELIEATYVEFRDRRESSRRMATCTCKACQMIPRLDLKFITHYGDYVLQSYSGKQKPLGSSVNMIHRLLKNRITEATGWQGYALFTEESLRQMDVYPLNVHSQVETYEHLGDVKTHSINLQDRYRDLTEERRMFLKPEDADVVYTHEYLVSSPELWQWLHDPQKRVRWMIGSNWHNADRPQGRTGRDATNHCSNSDVLERILDWRPFDYYSVRLIKSPMNLTMTVTLDSTDRGTRASWNIKFNGRFPRWLRRSICKFIVDRKMGMKENIQKLAGLVTELEPVQEGIEAVSNENA
jgi:hypothetical protein